MHLNVRDGLNNLCIFVLSCCIYYNTTGPTLCIPNSGGDRRCKPSPAGSISGAPSSWSSEITGEMRAHVESHDNNHTQSGIQM